MLLFYYNTDFVFLCFRKICEYDQKGTSDMTLMLHFKRHINWRVSLLASKLFRYA